MGQISWRTSVDDAIEAARNLGRPILLGFSNAPECLASTRLETDTLADEDVRALLGSAFIPVRIRSASSPDLRRRYRVHWTPTHLVLDEAGTERYRIVGYLPPLEFRARLVVSMARAALEMGEYVRADALFEDLIASAPGTASAPEALYWAGVNRYRRDGAPDGLVAAWTRLKTQYPESEWAEKVSFLDDP